MACFAHSGKWVLLGLILSVVLGCGTSPPSDVNNICTIFTEKKGWYQDAANSTTQWGSSIWVMMAMMHQESKFKASAKPPRKKIFGFIPGSRPSDAYGYSQALESTWDGYKHSVGRYGADRDDFSDAIDFIGWYNHQSYKRSGIKKTDTYRLYLAYHEGHGGYNRATYRKKAWLVDVARKVDRKATSYHKQLRVCEDSLKNDEGWFFGLF